MACVCVCSGRPGGLAQAPFQPVCEQSHGPANRTLAQCRSRRRRCSPRGGSIAPRGGARRRAGSSGAARDGGEGERARDAGGAEHRAGAVPRGHPATASGQPQRTAVAPLLRACAAHGDPPRDVRARPVLRHGAPSVADGIPCGARAPEEQAPPQQRVRCGTAVRETLHLPFCREVGAQPSPQCSTALTAVEEGDRERWPQRERAGSYLCWCTAANAY